MRQEDKAVYRDSIYWIKNISTNTFSKLKGEGVRSISVIRLVSSEAGIWIRF